MKKKITATLIAMSIIFSLFTINLTTFAQESTGYWKFKGTGGTTEFSVKEGGWLSREDFIVAGSATFYSTLKEELIHQAIYTWTPPVDKIYPGEVFPFTAQGKVVSHTEPWFTSSSMTMQFYGAMFPQNWNVKDNNIPVSIDAKVPVGNPDEKNDKHFMRLRLTLVGGSSVNANRETFQYIYEWVPAGGIVEEPAPIKVLLNGNKLEFDVSPQIISGRTMVPLRKIFEALGAQVVWVEATKTIIGQMGTTIIVLTVDSAGASVNGEPKTLDVPATIVEGRTMVPARFISESLGCKVDWDAVNNSVLINSN